MPASEATGQEGLMEGGHHDQNEALEAEKTAKLAADEDVTTAQLQQPLPNLTSVQQQRLPAAPAQPVRAFPPPPVAFPAFGQHASPAASLHFGSPLAGPVRSSPARTVLQSTPSCSSEAAAIARAETLCNGRSAEELLIALLHKQTRLGQAQQQERLAQQQERLAQQQERLAQQQERLAQQQGRLEMRQLAALVTSLVGPIAAELATKRQAVSTSSEMAMMPAVALASVSEALVHQRKLSAEVVEGLQNGQSASDGKLTGKKRALEAVADDQSAGRNLTARREKRAKKANDAAAKQRAAAAAAGGPISPQQTTPSGKKKLVWPGKDGVLQWTNEWKGPIPAMGYADLADVWHEWSRGVVFMGGNLQTHPVCDMEREMFEKPETAWRTGELMRKKMDKFKRLVFVIILKARQDGICEDAAVAAVEAEAKAEMAEAAAKTNKSSNYKKKSLMTIVESMFQLRAPADASTPSKFQEVVLGWIKKEQVERNENKKQKVSSAAGDRGRPRQRFD